MKQLVHFLFLSIIITGNSKGQDLTELDCYLYSKLINERFEIHKDSSERKTIFNNWKKIEVTELVICKYSNISGLGPFDNAIKGISKETIDNYWDRNRKSFDLQDKIETKIKLTYLDSASSSEIFKHKKGWKKFFKEFPKSNGLIELSIIGYNKEMTQALICIGIQSDLFVGAGYFVYFEKVHNEWIIKEIVNAWVS